MKLLAVLLLAASAHAQVSNSRIYVIPRSDGSGPGEVRFFDTSGKFYTALKAAPTVATSGSYNLPADDAKNVLCSDGASNWILDRCLKISIWGNANETLLSIRGHSTQTADPFRVLDQGNNLVFSLANQGQIELNRPARNDTQGIYYNVSDQINVAGSWFHGTIGVGALSTLEARHNGVARFTLSETGDVTNINALTAAGQVFGAAFNSTDAVLAYRVQGSTVIDASRNITAGNVVPITHLTFDLGSSIKYWNKLWINDIDIAGTCTGSGCSSAAAPLGEIKITNHGAVSNCTTPTDISAAVTAAIAALPTDAGGEKSGIITFPAGCYGWDLATAGSLIIDRLLGHGDITLAGAGAGGEFAVVGAGTEIRVIGSAPGSPTPVINWKKSLGGGLSNIQINAAGVANTYGVRIEDTRFHHIENIQVRRHTNGPGLQYISATAGYSGSCHNSAASVETGDVRDTDNASGLDLGGTSTTGNACSNSIRHGMFIYSKNGATSYGIHWGAADSNQLDRVNSWASDCTAFPCESNFGTGRHDGSQYALLMTQTTGGSYPSENYFSGTLIAQTGRMIGGAPGVAGNYVTTNINDCGGLLVGCFPDIRNIRGRTSYGEYAGRSLFVHSDLYQATYTLDQSNGGLQSSGRLSFARQDRVRGAIQMDYTTGMGIYTAGPNCNLFAAVGNRSPHTILALTSITVSSGVATANLGSAHDCTTANRVRITESTTSTLNGEAQITAVATNSVSWTTAAGNGTYNNTGLTVEVAPRPWWTFSTSGQLLPFDSSTSVDIGTLSIPVNRIYSREFKTYTNGAFGSQFNTFIADNNLNLDLITYSSAAAADRPALTFRRGRGSIGSPLTVAVNDVLGEVTAYGNTTSAGLIPAATIQFVTEAITATTISGKILFQTTNGAAAPVTRFAINANGNTDFGATMTVNNLSVLGTFTGSLGAMNEILFADTVNQKLRFFNAAGVHYGIGIAASEFRHYVATTGDVFSWGHGTYAAFNERVRLTNTAFQPIAHGTMDSGNPTNGRWNTVYAQHINTSTSGAGTQQNTLLGEDNLNLDLYTYSSTAAADRAAIGFYRARNTPAVPIAVVAGDRLGRFAGFGYTTTASFLPAAQINFITEAVSSTTISGKIEFQTTNVSTGPVNRFVINANGTADFISTVSSAGFTVISSVSRWVMDANNLSGYDSSSNVKAVLANSTGVFSVYSGNQSIVLTPSTPNIAIRDSSGVLRTDLGLTWVQYDSAGTVRAQISPNINIYTSGATNVFSVSSTSGNVTAAGVVQSNGGFNAGGFAGMTATINYVKNGALTVCTMAIAGGIITGITGAGCP